MTAESLALLLDEISAGAKVVLAEVICAPRDDDHEQFVAQHRRSYLFARKTLTAANQPTYSRATVEQARVLMAAGAVWVGSAADDPSVQ